jgi:hypothetical protein
LGTNQRNRKTDKTQENKALTFVGFSFVFCWGVNFVSFHTPVTLRPERFAKQSIVPHRAIILKYVFCILNYN